ncbi:MAG TPA: YihY/virulence factor BrkB family protein [Nocardioidaceae bacterium]|nr:YihY/virulence factor BrkB family protein [Nocardioidaceae bacterium]
MAWRLGERTVRDSIADRLPGLAAETALFTLLSLPSLLLVMLGSLGYLADALGPAGSAELERLVFDLPQALLSAQTYESYRDMAETVLQDGRADVVSIGVVVSLWTGSRAMTRYLETITIAYDIDDPRPIWRRRLLAFVLTVAALATMIALLPALVLGPQIIEWAAPPSVAGAAVDAADVLFWPGMALLALVALASLYHIGVPWPVPWRRDLPGATLALGLWLLASAGLRTYVAVAVQGQGVYGQLGTPIAVVLWLYVTAFAVLLGAELNAEIEKMWPHGRYPWRLRSTRNPAEP